MRVATRRLCTDPLLRLSVVAIPVIAEVFAVCRRLSAYPIQHYPDLVFRIDSKCLPSPFQALSGALAGAVPPAA